MKTQGIVAMGILLALGCSKKQSTAPPPEALSATSDGTVHDYQLPSGVKEARVKIGVKFTSTTSSKTCLLDSIQINSPNDSVTGGRAVLRKLWLDTLASGDTTSREFTIADTRNPIGREPGVAPYPPGHGKYYVVVWGRWDMAVHQSPEYAWTW